MVRQHCSSQHNRRRNEMPRSEEGIYLKYLREAGAVTVGHINFRDGDHGNAEIRPSALYAHTKETSLMCRGIAERFQYDKVETVVSLTVGGNSALSQWTAHHLSELCRREVYASFAEREDPPPSMIGILSHRGRRNKLTTNLNHRSFISGRRVLIVGDFLTTGEHAKKLIEAVREVGGKVVGIGVLSNCAKVLPKDLAKIPKLVALMSLNLGKWSESKCPICKRNKLEAAKKNR